MLATSIFFLQNKLVPGSLLRIDWAVCVTPKYVFTISKESPLTIQAKMHIYLMKAVYVLCL